eukprot:4312337-Alexandrium_andersonii.AAC.1
MAAVHLAQHAWAESRSSSPRAVNHLGAKPARSGATARAIGAFSAFQGQRSRKGERQKRTAEGQ